MRGGHKGVPVSEACLLGGLHYAVKREKGHSTFPKLKGAETARPVTSNTWRSQPVGHERRPAQPSALVETLLNERAQPKSKTKGARTVSVTDSPTVGSDPRRLHTMKEKREGGK